MDISPLAPKQFPSMPNVKGVILQTFAARDAKKNRDDLLLMQFIKGTKVAGTFTQSKTRSSAVEYCVEHLGSGQDGRLLIVNSGNSNAFTGRAGQQSVQNIIAHLADKFKIQQQEIYTSSTGVIGELLPASKLLDVIDQDAASAHKNTNIAAAKAIMTTDTFAKYATKTVQIAGEDVVINAIAKGSGMIAPDMATMLSYIYTDANINQAVLQNILSKAVTKSFNSITVDSDTSTSDTVLLFATGASNAPEISQINDPRLTEFTIAIHQLCLEMAQQIVKDGEGAEKFITINVNGAENDQAAHIIGMSIANSPLVKTAIAGEDANWGRIIMAIGKSGEMADRDLIEISIGGVKITQFGQVIDGYDEHPVTQHIKGQHVNIAVDLGLATGQAEIYTCDLTYGYIRINADYRS